jgi:hypothetical protein
MMIRSTRFLAQQQKVDQQAHRQGQLSPFCWRNERERRQNESPLCHLLKWRRPTLNGHPSILRDRIVRPGPPKLPSGNAGRDPTQRIGIGTASTPRSFLYQAQTAHMCMVEF